MPAEVPIFGDYVQEAASETFTLNLSGASGATLADGTGAGTITDDDAAGLSITDAVVRERLGTTSTITFTVNLAPTTRPARRRWSSRPERRASP